MKLSENIWEAPKWPLPLLESEVHLWKLQLNQPAAILDKFMMWLSEYELERAESYSFEEGRQNFILARGGLRFLIGHYLQIEPGDIQFEYTSRGKPEIGLPEAGQRLKFSLAHSGDLALFGFTWDKPIGVDLELLSRRIDLKLMAPRVLSPEERKVFEQLPAEAKMGAFLSAWTQKEAVLKAIGTGLTRSMDQIIVDFTPLHPSPQPSRHSVRRGNLTWNLSTFQVEPGALGALAVESPTFHLKFHKLLLDPEHF